MTITKIKICGLKRFEDIEFVNRLIPDYVGFVFAKSKRQVSWKLAVELAAGLNKKIKTVGVFVDEEPEKVRIIAEDLKLSVIQLHGKEDRRYVEEFGDFEVWKSKGIDVSTEECEYSKLLEENQKKLNELSEYPIDKILFDSSVKGVTGGTGTSFNWDIVNRLKINRPLILAGGLTSQNVEEAILKTQPYAVDVSGGVETEGVKDFEKIKDFIEKVRNTI
jgi:phosphoribosylanthranilate isomerase